MNDSQYLLRKAKLPNGMAIPMACDVVCQDSLKPKNSPNNCEIETVCIQSDISVEAIKSQINGDITISQNCGNTGGGDTDPNKNWFDKIKSFVEKLSKEQKVAVAVVWVVAILAIVVWRRSK
jgi:hypothetical protein